MDGREMRQWAGWRRAGGTSERSSVAQALVAGAITPSDASGSRAAASSAASPMSR